MKKYKIEPCTRVMLGVCVGGIGVVIRDDGLCPEVTTWLRFQCRGIKRLV
jgi:hypothetical protein